MGSNRSLNQNKPAAEVFKRIVDDFGVEKKHLFSIWSRYMKKRCNGKGAAETIESIKYSCIPDSGTMYNALNYFAAVGMELFAKEYLEVMEGKNYGTNQKK